MTSDEMGALLERLDERTINICKKMDDLIKHADNGGWGRCAERGVEIKELKAGVSELKSENRKFKWMVFTGLFTVILGIIFL